MPCGSPAANRDGKACRAATLCDNVEAWQEHAGKFVDWGHEQLHGRPGAAPRAWYFHGELTEDYVRHYTAEYVNEKGLWECPSGKDNHLWDCGVYNLIAADIIGGKFWQKGQATSADQKVKLKLVNNPYTEGYQFFQDRNESNDYDDVVEKARKGL